MRRLAKTVIIGIAFIITGMGIFLMQSPIKTMPQKISPVAIQLPAPNYSGSLSVEEALQKRRSVRKYKDEPLVLSDVSQLLWAAQGITDPNGHRTSPSAGALYPLEVYLAAGKVKDLPEGVYKYSPDRHELLKVEEGDKRAELAEAAYDQNWIGDSAAVIVIAAAYERTTVKYGKRGIRYAEIEVGNAAQNIYLQAESLNLGTVFVGAFEDSDIHRILGMEPNENPLSLMPVGKR